MTQTSQTIQLPDSQSAIALAGSNEQNLKLLSRQTGVNLILRGQDLLIQGQEKAVERCVKAIRTLEPLWSVGETAIRTRYLYGVSGDRYGTDRRV